MCIYIEISKIYTLAITTIDNFTNSVSCYSTYSTKSVIFSEIYRQIHAKNPIEILFYINFGKSVANVSDKTLLESEFSSDELCKYFEIENIKCGVKYEIPVSYINVAYQNEFFGENIWEGEINANRGFGFGEISGNYYIINVMYSICLYI